MEFLFLDFDMALKIYPVFLVDTLFRFHFVNSFFGRCFFYKMMT